MQTKGPHTEEPGKSDLKDWFLSPLGQHYLESESKELSQLVSNLYGNVLLCLGEASFTEVLKQSPIPFQVWVHPNPFASTHSLKSIVCSRQDKLAIGNDEIHVVYLAHCLEFVNNPHEVLRESYRVVVPEGHVVISGFNPWGLWGTWRLFARFRKKWPWTGQFISVTRLKDWLALLGFDIVSVKFYFFRPPIGFRKVVEKLKWLESIGSFLWPFFGGSYVILAKKRVIPLTLIKPKWLKKEKLVVEGLAEPTTRNS